MMREDIKKRIEAVRRGEVPEGYHKDYCLMPIEWNSTELKNIAKKVSQKNRGGEDVAVLSNSAVRGVVLQREYFEKDIVNNENTDGYFVVEPGDYIYNPRISVNAPFGPIKRNSLGHKGIVSPLYTVFRTKKGEFVDERYLEYFFLSTQWNRFVYTVSNQGVRFDRMNITDNDFFCMPIVLPPIAEQRKIAEILATCDRMIELKQQLFEEKRRQKQWLMQKLLDPNAGVNQPECSGVKWITRCIKELGTVITGSTPDKSCDEFWGGDFPWITSQDFTGKYIGIAEVHVTDAGKKKCRVLPAGAVLVTCIASIGLNAIAKVECATNQQINAVICNGICSEEMLYYIIEYNRGALERIAGKTAVPIISKDQFEKIKVTIPESRSEQDKITKVLSAADSEIQLLQNELEIWQQKKKALMQLLLTGLVRVNA